MTAATSDVAVEQARVVLTPHPLQRVGAHVLVALSREKGAGPETLSAAGLDAAMGRVAVDAGKAATRESKSPDGFWQKVSLSFFPNSPMNHPGRRKGKNAAGEAKSDADVRAAVRDWLTCPPESEWPPASCVLCGRDAVGFYGKRDVPLAESEAYRNSTPRGHEGVALCWPCLCCSYALPYGCHLTGGSSVAVHSWDESFLGRTVRRRARHNRAVAATGKVPQSHTREVVALRALRRYSDPLTDGVELLVFNNNNRGQLLESYALQQPLAEWLRRTSRPGDQRRGFGLLVRAHTTANTPGIVGLARNAFRTPTQIVSAGLRGLTTYMFGPAPDAADVAALAQVLFSFATEVEQVNEKDLRELRTTAAKVASLLAQETTWGGLKELRAKMRNSRQLRSWLTNRALAWAASPPSQAERQDLAGPLVSERAFVLLFDPGQDNPSWFHRDLLLVGVLEELSRLEWRAQEGEKPEEALAELAEQDRKFIETDEEEEEDAA
jgi:hypothetical protein